MDCRAIVQIKFGVFGEDPIETDMWINYYPNSCGVDDRVIEFFKEVYDKHREAYEDRMFEASRAQRERALKENELKELD